MPTFREFAHETHEPREAISILLVASLHKWSFETYLDSRRSEGGIHLIRQTSPFAELTGDEKQIKWLEYQSLKLPYVQAAAHTEQPASHFSGKDHGEGTEHAKAKSQDTERPQPPPEVPRVMPVNQQIRHSQYDAVIARMKQAELQSRHHPIMSKVTQ